MIPDLKRLPAHFYRSASGHEPEREWLKDLEPQDRKAIGEDIKTLSFHGRSACRSLVRLAASCWKSAAASHTDASHGFFFVWSGGVWCCFTGSSRRPKRPRNTTSI